MNGKVVISTDCVCDLTPELVERFDIPIMYYYVQTEEARFQDIREISSDNLIEYMQEGKKALSSCASGEEYGIFFGELREKYPDSPIIHICMAEKVSNACSVAGEAAKAFEDIFVVNSGHLSGGMAIMVLNAADMAKRGAVCEIILEELERLKYRVSSSFVVDSTEMLCKNGRISARVDTLCRVLKLHPILKLQDSRMFPVSVCIGGRKSFAVQYLKWALRRKKAVDCELVFLITAGCTYEFTQFLKQELERMLPWDKVIVNVASATISCNCGAGSFGILFLHEEK